MARHNPLPTRTTVRAPRVLHYPDPANPYGVQMLTPAELAAKQARDRVLYARWVTRQVAIAERDRKLRRFWLGFGASLGGGLLAGLVVAGWLLVHALGVLGVLAIPAALAVVAAIVVGGHRCITVVQHWH